MACYGRSIARVPIVLLSVLIIAGLAALLAALMRENWISFDEKEQLICVCCLIGFDFDLLAPAYCMPTYVLASASFVSDGSCWVVMNNVNGRSNIAPRDAASGR